VKGEGGKGKKGNNLSLLSNFKTRKWGGRGGGGKRRKAVKRTTYSPISFEREKGLGKRGGEFLSHSNWDEKGDGEKKDHGRICSSTLVNLTKERRGGKEGQERKRETVIFSIKGMATTDRRGE